MDVVQLLADEDRLIKEAHSILMQDRFISPAEIDQVEKLRDQVLAIQRQLAQNPHFHPETLAVRYLH